VDDQVADVVYCGCDDWIGGLKVRSLVTFLVVLLSWQVSAHAQIAFGFEDWRGYYTVSTDGKFQSCYVEAQFSSGDKLQFWLTPAFDFAFDLQRLGRIDPNQKTAQLWVDDNEAFRAEIAVHEPFAIFNIGHLSKKVVAFYEALRLGRVLSIEIGGTVHKFSLTGTYGALSELFGCANQARAGHPPRALEMGQQVAAVPKQQTSEPQSRSGPKTAIGSASVFFVSEGGVLLTNAHAVAECSEIKVTTDKGDEHIARVIALDKQNDLAALRAAGVESDPIRFRQGLPRLGEPVFAYGFPLNSLLSTSGTFGAGMVSALVGLRDDSGRLQISVPVQPGNSGGPLLDAKGALVGIIVGKLNAVSIVEKTGDIPQNVNFAIKASVAQAFLESHDAKPTPSTSARTLEPADIAELAKRVSVRLDCFK
jgi:S1-C subfamily serine protease